MKANAEFNSIKKCLNIAKKKNKDKIHQNKYKQGRRNQT